jgi:excisionase family DNA binding protein
MKPRPNPDGRPGDRLAYSPAEAAAVIGCSRSVLYQKIAAKELRAKKLDSRTVVVRADLERFLESLPNWEPNP